jgi:hypothetical protein
MLDSAEQGYVAQMKKNSTPLPFESGSRHSIFKVVLHRKYHERQKCTETLGNYAESKD